MNKIGLSLLLLLSSLGFNSAARPDTYGLLMSDKNHKPILRYELPLEVYVDLTDAAGWDDTSDNINGVIRALLESVDWINSYLGMPVIMVKFHHGEYNAPNLGDGKAHFAYVPRELVNQITGRTIDGHCAVQGSLSILGPSRITDSVIYIYRKYESWDHILFSAVVRHEILHALGFDHAPKGIMVEAFNYMSQTMGIIDYIDVRQLQNWQQWTKNGYRWWGEGPKHEPID